MLLIRSKPLKGATFLNIPHFKVFVKSIFKVFSNFSISLITFVWALRSSISDDFLIYTAFFQNTSSNLKNFALFLHLRSLWALLRFSSRRKKHTAALLLILPYPILKTELWRKQLLRKFTLQTQLSYLEKRFFSAILSLMLHYI